MACKPESGQDTVGNYEGNVRLKVTNEKVIIPLDSETLTRSECNSLIKDGNRWILTWLNRKKNAIQFYDIASGDMVKRVTIPADGPDGVGAIEGYFIKSCDSLYIVSRVYSKIYLTSDSSKILQVIDYTYDERGDQIYPSSIKTANLKRIEFIGDKLYLPDVASGNWQVMTKQQLLNSKLSIEVDTTTKRIKRLPFTYPPDYWAEGKREPIYSRIYENGKFIYSFFGDHHIYVTTDHVSTEKYTAKSKYFKTLGVYPKEMGMNEYLRYICEYGHYATIVFDKWREVYYRFVILPSTLQLSDDLMRKVYNPESISIIIMDEQFKIKGETKLPKNRFIPDNFFINEEGLYLSDHHIENSDVSDDHLSFTLLRLEQTDLIAVP